MSKLIAAKIIIGLAVAAVVAILSGCAPARLVFECARGSLSCQ